MYRNGGGQAGGKVGGVAASRAAMIYNGTQIQGAPSYTTVPGESTASGSIIVMDGVNVVDFRQQVVSSVVTLRNRAYTNFVSPCRG